MNETEAVRPASSRARRYRAAPARNRSAQRPARGPTSLVSGATFRLFHCCNS